MGQISSQDLDWWKIEFPDLVEFTFLQVSFSSSLVLLIHITQKKSIFPWELWYKGDETLSKPDFKWTCSSFNNEQEPDEVYYIISSKAQF